MKDYWAHSTMRGQPSNSREGWQRLSDHLHAVRDLAGKLARAARPKDDRLAKDAETCGLLHDYGKYTECFQKMLSEGHGKCQHAIHGAMLSYFGNATEKPNPGVLAIVSSVAGHHAGLADKPDLVDAKLKGTDRQTCKLREEMRAIFENACGDLPALREAVHGLATAAAAPPLSATPDLYTRMLFSCLVDADRLDTAKRKSEQAPLDAGDKLESLLDHLRQLSDQSEPGIVKDMRARVLADCLTAADRAEKLFSLSVPTGGGKTLASMAFALRRAALFPKDFRRVIVVIPYLSIIEQNAEVYARVFGPGALLEHHSGSLMKLKTQTNPGAPEGPDRERYVAADEDVEETEFQTSGYRAETENWDAPLIVTTSVRFFESLFSNRPKDLRRVHNIARSIVILDEVQTLPLSLIGPLLGMMKELSDDWGVNFVFSTATQPAFQSESSINTLLWKPGTLCEIVSHPEPLRKALKRAEISWEIETPASWAQVAHRAVAAGQSLTIVNLRDHARELFTVVESTVAERGLDPAGVYHLSTRMCAAHRLRVIEMIRKRLKAKLSCHVVSTQLVEAGVDLDFPLVLRALAPLDSIVQAAGRADREGKLTASLGKPGGRVVVFLPEENRTPPNEYAEATALTRVLCNERDTAEGGIQVDDPRALPDYFRRYYGHEDARLGKRLVEFRSLRKFKTLADEFEMISNRTKDVYVGHDAESRQLIEEAEREFRERRHFTPELRKKLQQLQRSIVGLGPWEFDKARAAGVIAEVVGDSGIWIATGNAYTERLGLALELLPQDLVL
jgi:CRISPR-associated endonuclease/helicase Cas3